MVMKKKKRGCVEGFVIQSRNSANPKKIDGGGGAVTSGNGGDAAWSDLMAEHRTVLAGAWWIDADVTVIGLGEAVCAVVKRGAQFGGIDFNEFDVCVM